MHLHLRKSLKAAQKFSGGARSVVWCALAKSQFGVRRNPGSCLVHALIVDHDLAGQQHGLGFAAAAAQAALDEELIDADAAHLKNI